jgi:hypothetical protein
MRSFVRLAQVAALALLAAGLAGPAAADDSPPISRAETLLFMTNHMKQLSTPSRLHYAFSKTGTLEPGFKDTIDIDITSQADGSKKGAAKFFNGEHNISYPDVEHVEGNPVVMFFLEREIREMSRLTGGKPNYFRKRIRLALSDSASIKPVEVSYGGHAFAAQQITITPYRDDPMSAKFERMVPKRYVFTISEQVPGEVYQIEGLVPPADASAKDAVQDEKVTLLSSGAPK